MLLRALEMAQWVAVIVTQPGHLSSLCRTCSGRTMDSQEVPALCMLCTGTSAATRGIIHVNSTVPQRIDGQVFSFTELLTKPVSSGQVFPGPQNTVL